MRGELLDGGESRAQWREREREQHGRAQEHAAFLATVSQGQSIAPGKNCQEAIAQTLSTFAPNQVIEVLAQMKARCVSLNQ